MKKILFYTTSILVIFFILVLNLDSIRTGVVQRLNEDQKQKIRDLFFGKGEAALFKKYKLFGKMNYNQNVLPNTQFIDLNFYEKNLKDLDLSESTSTWNPGSVQFFLENYKDRVILADSGGNFFFIENKSLNKSQNLNFKKIKNNFKFENKIGSIRDIHVHNDKLFVSFSDFLNDCTKINIVVSKIDENLTFENFFQSKDCSSEFDAGRVNYYKHEEKEGILITTDTEMDGVQAQDLSSSFGKILFVDFQTQKSEIFSLGHRTPQGLHVEANLILAAEHGPRGGDEINNIKFNGNYGWPKSSYGEPYLHQEFYEKDISKEEFFYKKNHIDHGFIEPVYAFIPSIGINQIIRIPNNFSKFWNESFFITSLNGRSVYRLVLNKSYNKVLSMEKIFIGKRIRDIIYNEQNNIFILALEGKKGSKSSDNQPNIGILKAIN